MTGSEEQNIELSSNEILVYKLDHLGREVWHYIGRVLSRSDTWVQLEALFNRDDKDAGYVIFRRNDRFIEWFYSNQWYNIFEIHDVDDDHLKGWYCNISRPAEITQSTIRSDDLALDVWIAPTGASQILDQDELDALNLDVATLHSIDEAVWALKAHLGRREIPFHIIPTP